jgi:hypothetical protein
MEPDSVRCTSGATCCTELTSRTNQLGDYYYILAVYEYTAKTAPTFYECLHEFYELKNNIGAARLHSPKYWVFKYSRY